MKSHAQELRSFARSLSRLLMFRGAVRWSTVWFFFWGVVILAARIAGVRTLDWLAIGLLGAVPLAGLAAFREWRRRAEFASVRAAYDNLNHCGGMVMAEEAAEMSAWQANLPPTTRPVLRWRSGRSLGLMALAAIFVLVTLCLPDRLTAFAAKHPLQIGKLLGELRTEVETLKQEKIIEPNKAEELQKQLSRLKDESSAVDPNKTWEALDHIKESNTDLARQAAEEALSKTSSLTEAQTLANALQLASESGLSQDTATQAAQDLAGMLKAAKLEDGLLKGEIPPGLLAAGMNGLSQEDLAKLLSAIQSNKNNFGRTMTNLANLKLIDAKMLGQCKNAGEAPNADALAKYLSQCTNQCDSISQLASSYCRGGVDRGRGDAPMTWKTESSPEGAKFKEEVLPPANRSSDSQVVTVSRTAPDLSGDGVVTEHGALANAQAGGGAAYSQVVLPRHKKAVQQFFKRDP